MNCRTFRKRQAELLDKCPDPKKTADLISHAAICSDCARELEDNRALIARIIPSEKFRASSHIKEQIMSNVTEINAMQTQRVSTWKFTKLIRVGALAAILLLSIFIGGRFAGRQSPACATLAQAAEYIHGVRTIHICARMRTIPRDNFDYIDLNAPLIPIEMWKKCGDPTKIRIEKDGRLIVSNGEKTIILIGSREDICTAKSSSAGDGSYPTLAPLLHADTLFQREYETAKISNSLVSLEKKIGTDGRLKTILTIEADAQGDFSESEYAKNKSIIESNNTRIYTFDAETSRCEKVQVYMHADGKDILVFETTKIEYDIPLSTSIFNLEVQKNAIWYKTPDQLGARDNSWLQPDDVALEFFNALSNSDWLTVKQLGAAWIDDPERQNAYAGLKVVSIGKPFQSGLYPGWFVPYEIHLKNGEVRKHKLAVRNDNPKHQWTYNGGF